ncbi:hypothetical protein ACLB2K_070695 [Fragaria x ananassa]
MERKELLVCCVVGLLGLVSAATGFAAEATRIKGSQVQFVNATQCEYPRTAALGLGFTAAVSLMVAHIIINVSTGCICCKRIPQPSNSNWTIALICFVVSWFSFVIAFLLLLTGSALNDQHGVESMYFGSYYCYVVKPGVFAGGSMSSSSTYNSNSRGPLQEQFIQRKSSRENLDRFIPNRSAMDMGYAQSMLTDSRKGKENPAVSSPSREAYQRKLAEALNMNRTRILAFKNKPPAPVDLYPKDFFSSQTQDKPAKPRRHIPQTSERTLDAPDLVDDYYLNLLDWGSANVLAIALANTVYLWDASTGSTSELETFDDETGPVTSVSWAPDGRHIAIGLNNSEVQLWDSTATKQLRTLRGCHSSRVGSLAWNNNILTTGGMDGCIVNNDVRVRSHIVETYRGHEQEVCGLKWSASGQQLASGGNDNLLHIWDRSVASSQSSTQWLHRLEDHTAAVKALAWCPFQSNLLASGGGGGDRCIKFWNTHTGACLNSVDTGSQVCSLLWNKNERELLSSHGFTQNQLTLWKYPSMVKMAELTGHTSRVLYMAQSPDGCTVASAAGDETLRFWNVFGVPEVAKPAPKASEPFAHLNRIR